MPNDGQIVFEVTADGKKAIANIKDITDAIKAESKKWDQEATKGTEGIENSFAAMAKKVVAGLSAAKVAQTLMSWGKAAIEAASDLQEVQNVVDTTFGDGAAQIERWAKTAGTQFGLTETQAKRFTSTLGAMMKSAGMSGNEIVDMSTDLAGLAADMASFYNLDFDTAFQKIRSGISGETEPLKQLGVNMSVANLEAFALQKGLSKAFNEMTQGEQTMLRYQYLMQATADAQGDFAKTADGYANASRRIETAITSIQTSLGTILMPIVQSATEQLATFLESLTSKGQRTVLDDFNDIDLNTAEKIAQVESTASQAKELISVLESIQGMSELTSLKNDLEGIAKNKSAKGIKTFAEELAKIDLTGGKTEILTQTLATLRGDISSLSDVSGVDAVGAQMFLNKIEEAAKGLSPDDVKGWSDIASSIAELMPGLEGTTTGKSLLEALGLDQSTGDAASNLEALGIATEGVEDKQALWLETCKRLVQTIPGLNSIINTETGEINGGIQAVTDYVQAWEDGQKKLIAMRALEEKKQAVANKKVELVSYELDMRQAQIALDNFEKEHPELTGKNDATSLHYSASAKASGYSELVNKASETAKAFEDQSKAVEEAEKQLKLYEQAVEEMPGIVEEAVDATQDFGDKTTTEWQQITGGAQEAIKALNDYVQSVRDATSSEVGNTLTGFEQIKTAKQMSEEAANKLKDLKAELETAGKTPTEIELKLNAENAQVTLESLRKGLQSQLDFINEYQDNLKKARELGVSDTLLASLSDGSTESAQTLYALTEAYQNWNAETDGIPEDIKALNDLFDEVGKGKEEFTDTLTQQKLSVDDTYAQMVATAKEKIAEMDLGEEAQSAMGDTVSGLAQGIKDHVGEVADAVDSILSELNRLNSYGISVNLGSFGTLSLNIPQHETGLDHVPFDGYLASLHEGEGILTAEENRIWQRFRNGDSSSRNVDYEALGGVMRDNVKAGGDVYLNGRVVGAVVSDIQGAQFRNLRRSGWQA